MYAKAQQDKTMERLLSWLQQRENEMATLLADLIAVPTENPPGGHYGEFAEIIENRAQKLGLQFECLETSTRMADADEVPPLSLRQLRARGTHPLFS
jgi:acetylornithine deacetylase/succinyl-diaminopimelate desuccinylase-like protein